MRGSSGREPPGVGGMGIVEMAVPNRKPESRARQGARALVASSSPAASRPADRARGFVRGV